MKPCFSIILTDERESKLRDFSTVRDDQSQGIGKYRPEEIIS